MMFDSIYSKLTCLVRIKEASLEVGSQSLRYSFFRLARWHLRARYDAWCARHRYGDTLEKGILWRIEHATSHFGR